MSSGSTATADWVAVLMVSLHAALSTALFVLARRSATGRLARNRWFGIRTPRSLASDHAWRRVHRAAAPWIYAAAAVLVPVVTAMALARDHQAAFLITLITGDVLVAVCIGAAAVAGHRGLDRSP